LTAAAASPTRIDLSWRDNSGNESGFRIERKTGSGSWSQIATVGANGTGFSDTGLSASTTYTYRVRSYNAGGASAYSNETSADAGGEPPAAPAKLTAKAITTSRVDLRWRDRSDDESGFRIDRKMGSDKWSKVAKVGADVTRFSDTGLNPESTYAFRVRALNAAGKSDPSNVAKTITAAPAAPSKLTAKALSSSRITLSWRDKSNNETGFRIYRKLESGAWSQIAKVGADTTSFMDTGLRSSTAYLYRVRAVNAIGQSKYSKKASAATR
jgi:predicted phage tail protein